MLMQCNAMQAIRADAGTPARNEAKKIQLDESKLKTSAVGVFLLMPK
jgi:hypothetical protein